MLVLSSRPTIRLATEVIRGGAEDFVPIPYSEELLLKEVERILEAAELRDRVESLHRLVADTYGLDRIVSRSSRMRPVLERARAASRSETPVLITGETGTGKELVARAIHANSRRARQPLVPLNCAALPRDLVESELFGHRRGRVLRRADRSPRAVRRRPPRHALPGRDRGAAARGAGQAAPRPSGRRGAAGRRPREPEGRRADHRRQQPLARRHGRRCHEAGPLLPPLGPRHRDAPAPGAARRPPASRRVLPGPDPRAGRRTRGERGRPGSRADGWATRSPETCASSRTCSRESASRSPPTDRRYGRRTCEAGCDSRSRSGPRPVAQGPSLRLHDLEAWAITEALKQTEGTRAVPPSSSASPGTRCTASCRSMGPEAAVPDSRT